jgi:hypothetical protein
MPIPLILSVLLRLPARLLLRSGDGKMLDVRRVRWRIVQGDR